MKASSLLQPPPIGTLVRFATATTGLLGADSAETLQEHLRALAGITGAELVLLYHGVSDTAEFDLVASFGVPREAVAALRRARALDDPARADRVAAPATPDPLPRKLADIGIQARWDAPLREDGGCIGRLVFGSRRWQAFHPDTIAVLAAAAAQIALVLQRRLAEQGDAKAASSTDLDAGRGAEPLLFRRRRDRFVALLAHELRNPVAPIRSGLDLLATDRLAASARHDTVRMMQRQVEQLAHLIDDFLDTARLDAGHLGANRRRVPLVPALDAAIESVAPAFRARNQRLERVGWPSAPVIVDADPVRLTQAFANLLAAGAAATPTGGTITVRLGFAAASANISFEDEAMSIDSDVARPGDVLATAGTSESDPGAVAGLGLVTDLVALNEGRVVAKNREGGGGRVFTVTLPSEAGAVADEARAVPVPMPRHHRILVVDDNRDAAESLGMLFRLDGHVVQLAHTGPEAVAAASEFGPEVVVMDLGLPGFSGHEAISRIRTAAGRQAPRIVALTGWGTRADRDASARAGADLHLVKPVAQATLGEAIERLLQPADPSTPAC